MIHFTLRDQDRYFWCHVDGNIKLSNLFCEMRLLRSLRPLRLLRLLRSLRPQIFQGPGKSLLSTPELSRLLNLALFWFWKPLFFSEIMKYNFLIFAPFLLEAVEASLCYFFENWCLKLKCPNLRNTQIPSFDLKVVFRWPSRSSKYIKSSRKTLYIRDQPYFTSAYGLGGCRMGSENGHFCWRSVLSFFADIGHSGWVGPKLFWRNIWMFPKTFFPSSQSVPFLNQILFPFSNYFRWQTRP